MLCSGNGAGVSGFVGVGGVGGVGLGDGDGGGVNDVGHSVTVFQVRRYISHVPEAVFSKLDCSITKRAPIPNDTSSESSLSARFFRRRSFWAPDPIPTVEMEHGKSAEGCVIYCTQYTGSVARGSVFDVAVLVTVCEFFNSNTPASSHYKTHCPFWFFCFVRKSARWRLDVLYVPTSVMSVQNRCVVQALPLLKSCCFFFCSTGVFVWTHQLMRYTTYQVRVYLMFCGKSLLLRNYLWNCCRTVMYRASVELLNSNPCRAVA